MKKLFVILTLFSIFNFVSLKAEEIDDNVTTYEITEDVNTEIEATGEEASPEQYRDIEVDQEVMYTTSEEELLTNLDSSKQDYTIYYVAIGGIIFLLLGVWLVIFNKARNMSK